MSEKKKLKVIDLFAWVGWLSYWFVHDDVFEVIAANEIDPVIAKAYLLNHPNVKMYCKDVKDFWIEDLNKDFWIKKWDIDIIVGWPPCQAYSTIWKRLIDDPRWKLFQEYYRVLKELEPKMFVFENVKWLLSMSWWDLIKTIVLLFESLGYKVKYEILNSADYWAPQLRERVIIVWTKVDCEYRYPKRTHYNPEVCTDSKWLKPYVTLWEAIWDLPFIKSWEEWLFYAKDPENDFQKLMRKNAPETLMDHNASKNNKNLVRLMEALPDGWSPLDIPENLRPSSWFWNTYCRLWWNKPCTTVTRNLWTPSSSRCIHPKVARALTTREWARIQWFPDDYKFYWSRSDKNLEIWNAVNVFLSFALKDSIKKYLWLSDNN